MEWDDRDQVNKEFPKSEWQHIPISDPDDGRMQIAMMAIRSNEPVLGEARWFAPGDGVVLVKKTATKVEDQVEKKVKKPWWKFW